MKPRKVPGALTPLSLFLVKLLTWAWLFERLVSVLRKRSAVDRNGFFLHRLRVLAEHSTLLDDQRTPGRS